MNAVLSCLLILIPAAGLLQAQSATYSPITGNERAKWLVDGVIGPRSLAGDIVGASLTTWRNDPEQWGPHWEGFGKRIGSSVGSSLTARTVEAGLGSIWGEDPRYFPASGGTVGHRVWHATRAVFVARNRNGESMPAYSRYVGLVSSNMVVAAWRPDSAITTGRIAQDTLIDFGTRALSNVAREFWPEVKRLMHH